MVGGRCQLSGRRSDLASDGGLHRRNTFYQDSNLDATQLTATSYDMKPSALTPETRHLAYAFDFRRNPELRRSNP
jgi:hypothetical protein